MTSETGGFPTAHRVYVAGPGLTPSRTHDDDAGFDLHCFLTKDVRIQPGEMVNLPTGIHVEIPPALFGWITPRSSTEGRGLRVVAAVIDPGYRGDLFIRVQNVKPQVEEGSARNDVRVKHGERLAQLILLPNIAPTIEMVGVEELAPSARGTNGFGSSGR